MGGKFKEGGGGGGGGLTNFLKNITTSSSSSFDRLEVPRENSGGDDVRRP